ncbi:MAG: HlyC/CorC family transporter [Pseudomonadota bacterium]
MSDPHPTRPPEKEDKRSFLQKVAEFIHPGPDSTQELIEVLAEAEDNELIKADARVMLERIIGLADMTAGDAMVAAPRMDVIDIDMPYDALLDFVIQTGHSRFPVYQGERENIIGTLMAKDLLKLQRTPDLGACRTLGVESENAPQRGQFLPDSPPHSGAMGQENGKKWAAAAHSQPTIPKPDRLLGVRALLRPAVFVPESKALDDLLREFRGNRNHMAVVIDEFGRVAGLITIEDVLEQIVGEIEDEFDIPEEEGDIFALADGTYRVSGDTPVERIREVFDAPLQGDEAEEQFATIGGLVAHEMGHVPKRGEQLQLAGLDFMVLHTKGGAVRWFKVARSAGAAG